MQSYELSSSAYYNRAIENLHAHETTQDPRFLFYASLELRSCIERFLFEYIVVVTTVGGQSLRRVKEYKPDDLERKLSEIDPEWQAKVAFVGLYLRALGAQDDLHVPDVKRLTELHGRLGNYLHGLKDPVKTTDQQQWWESFSRDLLDTRSCMFDFLKVGQASIDLNDDGIRLYEAFRDGTLQLSEIVAHVRQEESPATT